MQPSSHFITQPIRYYQLFSLAPEVFLSSLSILAFASCPSDGGSQLRKEKQIPSPTAKPSKMSKTTMKAVVFKGKLDVRIEDRPIPKLIDPTDIIIKVRYSALCGRYVKFPLHLTSFTIYGLTKTANSMSSEATKHPKPISLWATRQPAK